VVDLRTVRGCRIARHQRLDQDQGPETVEHAAALAEVDLIAAVAVSGGAPFTRIRPVSTAIATAVAELAYERGLAEYPRPADVSAFVRSLMYEPVYRSYVEGTAG